jgi:hypothetical protein
MRHGLGHDVPFNQVHGHAAPWNWQTGAFWEDTPADIRSRCQVDGTTRRTVTTLGTLLNGANGIAVSVDWNLSPTETRSWPLLTLESDLLFL